MSLAENKPADALAAHHRITEPLRAKHGDDLRVADAIDKQAALQKQLGNEKAATDLQSQATELRKRPPQTLTLHFDRKSEISILKFRKDLSAGDGYDGT